MRVGVVTTSYPREPGDPAGSFVAGFARWLEGAGAEVEVIAAGPGASRVDGIPVARLDGRGLFYRGGAPDALAQGGLAWAGAAAFQLELAARVAAAAPSWDAAVSHWVVPSGIAVALALPRRTPHLAIAHSSDVRLIARAPFGAALLAWLARRADLVYSARHLGTPGAPGRVVAMGADHLPGDRARGRARFGLDGVCALFVGRLVPVKGVDLLLEAFARDRGATLIIAGDGPCAADLRARARPLGDRVRLLGEVRGRDKADLLAACDLLCLPSRALKDGRSEGTPTVIGEALQAGLPLVAARTGGIADALTDGENALLCPPDAPALGAAVERLARDLALRERLSRGALASGAAFAWSAVGPRLAGRLADRLPQPARPVEVRSGLRTA